MMNSGLFPTGIRDVTINELVSITSTKLHQTYSLLNKVIAKKFDKEALIQITHEIYAEGVRIKSEENGGGDLTREQLEEINTDALKGATETLWLNAPAILEVDNNISEKDLLIRINNNEKLNNFIKDKKIKKKQILPKYRNKFNNINEKKIFNYNIFFNIID